MNEQYPNLIWSVGKKTEWEGDKVSILVVQCLALHPLATCQDIDIKLKIKTPWFFNLFAGWKYSLPFGLTRTPLEDYSPEKEQENVSSLSLKWIVLTQK